MEVVKKAYCNFVGFLEKKSLIAYITLFCVLAIYLCSVNTRSYDFSSLIENSKITGFHGYVQSNPVLTSSGKYYLCDFVPLKVYGLGEFSCYGALGTIKLLIPKQIVESHYPGKLYSSYGKTIFIENGAILNVMIKKIKNSSNDKTLSNNIFIVENVDFLGWKNIFSKIRGFFRLQFKRLMFIWGSAGGLLLALLSGAKEYTSFEFSENFRLSGLTHVLALSGMHVSIFYGITETTLKNIFGKKITKNISLVSVFLFVWFAGLSPSLTRALINSIILFFISILGIKMKTLDVLFFTFLVQVIIFPQDSFAISCILSYLALFGILTLGEFLKPFFTKFLGSSISSSLTSSIGAVLFTSPVCAAVWGYITPIGIISTMIISPIVNFFLIFGLFATIICLIFPFLTYPLGTILQIVYYCIEILAVFFAKVPPLNL